MLIIIKSNAGQFKHSGKYYLLNGRWHLLAHNEAAPKGASVAAHPSAAGTHTPVKHLTDEQWAKLKIDPSNVNAPSYNKHIDKLREMSEAGHVTGILGSSYGTNTYGKKAALVANHLLGLHGSEHKVTPGQKAGEHAAVQKEPTEAGHAEGDKWVMPLDAAIAEHKDLVDIAETASKEDDKAEAVEQAKEPARMEDAKKDVAQIKIPEFQEGKTVSGVVDYYNKVAQKIIALSGDAAALAKMKEDGLKPNSKGKISNTWGGKTANSKLLLALHAQAMGGAPAPAQSEQAQAAAVAAPAPAPAAVVVDKSAAQADASPKEGDVNAEGLVFHDGRWHREEAKPAAIIIRPDALKIDQAAHEAATSPTNNELHPTQAQLDAGNYKKGHVSIHGLDVAIENPRGSVRSGQRPDGSTWSHEMSDHYGYVKGSVGADGDHVDVYVGPNPESNKVFVIDQVNADGSFDEHKVMMGFDDQAQATAAYSSNFDKGWKVGPVTEMSVGDFKQWVKSDKTKEPLAVPPATEEGPQEGAVNAEGLVFRNGRWHRDGQQEAAADDGLSDDPNSPNYRFRDTGYIADSRKELAANSIKKAAKEGTRLRTTDIDWDAIEKNPRQARELIKKSNLFGVVDWSALKEEGMDGGAGFLIDRIYAAIPSEPDKDSPQKRHDFAIGLESLRDRLETCKTPDEVSLVLDEIKQEIVGTILTAQENEEYLTLSGIVNEARKQEHELKQIVTDAAKGMPSLQGQINNLEYQQAQRERRGWKPDPAVAAKILDMQHEMSVLEAEYKRVRALHPEVDAKVWREANPDSPYNNGYDKIIKEHYAKAQRVLKMAQLRNLENNPVTRAWLSFGPKFLGVLEWRSSRGSQTFAGHMTNARRGKIDWSWAEKESNTGPRTATKKEVSFQLKVAEHFSRVGGREIKVKSTLQLKDDFNLRDVQSGNWVLSDPASAEFHVQHAAEAFADLADIIGVPDSMVSMNGRLAMAFGARGTGNAGFGGAARASYNSVHRVINLTKMGGGGALGHEWFHGLDNLLCEASTGLAGKDDFLSENPSLLPSGELQQAFVDLHNTMRKGDRRAFQAVSYDPADIKKADYNIKNSYSELALAIKEAKTASDAVLAVNEWHEGQIQSRLQPGQSINKKALKNWDTWKTLAAAYHDRNPEGGIVKGRTGSKVSNFYAEAVSLDSGQDGKYWSETKEMAARAFQAYVEDKLAEKDRKNDYLSAFADNKYYEDPIFGDTKPFPEGEERKALNAVFDRLMSAVAKDGWLTKAFSLLV